MYKISSQTLDEIQTILGKRHEYCGIFIKHSNNMLMIHPKRVEGDLIKWEYDKKDYSRGTCSHNKFDLADWRFIYHTHPVASLPYPSGEDYVKVMPPSAIEYSLVFTIWGIWQIFIPIKVGFSENEAKLRHDDLNKSGHTHFFHPDSGIGYIFVKQDIENYLIEINSKLSGLNARIRFTSWKEQGNRDYSFV